MKNSQKRSFETKSASDDSSGNDYCWGRNPVLSLLEKNPSRCAKVIFSKTIGAAVSKRVSDLCRMSKIPFSVVESAILDSIIPGVSHQGVAAVVYQSEVLDLDEAVKLIPERPSPALVVLLDHIQDPGNLGAMIRSAEAANAIFVAVPVKRSSLPTGVVAKTSAGASLRLPLAKVGNVASAVRDLAEQGLWAIGLDEKAPKSIYESPLPQRTLLVVGGEEKGLGRTTADACDECLGIPISGGVGSLNASIALSVAMFEWSRVNISKRG